MSKQGEKVIFIIQKNKKKIAKFGVRKLALFGSFARGNANRSSDLDFIVEFEKKSFDAYMGLKFFLEKLFQRSVDLVLTETIKPSLREVIIKEAVYV